MGVASSAGFLAFSGAALAQGGYSVMHQNPAPANTTIPVVPSALGQNPADSRTPSHLAVVTGPRRPEEYGGLTPGAAHMAPGLARLARHRRDGNPIVAWPGFQMTPTGSRVFVAMTTSPVVSTSNPAALVQVFHLAHARIFLSNNRRPLITESFATPLRRASLRPSRGGVDLVLELRAPIQPSTHTETGPHGLQFLYIDLPPYQSPELVRLQLPNGQTVVTPDHNLPASNAAPTQPSTPGVDTERPPPVRR